MSLVETQRRLHILEKANFKFAHKKHTSYEYEGVSSTVAYEAKRERGASHTRVSTNDTRDTHASPGALGHVGGV